MRHVLHIVTKTNDAVAEAVVSNQKSLPQTKMEVVDLTGEQPDYTDLVKKIFAADSIQVW
jgi:hypothetical protein